jgi:hypothetical protein
MPIFGGDLNVRHIFFGLDSVVRFFCFLMSATGRFETLTTGARKQRVHALKNLSAKNEIQLVGVLIDQSDARQQTAHAG